VRDLRQLDRTDVRRAQKALAGLATGAEDLDVKPLAGQASWLRLRAGELRILYRPLTPEEAEGGGPGWLVARVVHRRDLERAFGGLGG
jgi:hypothetical protein